MNDAPTPSTAPVDFAARAAAVLASPPPLSEAPALDPLRQPTYEELMGTGYAMQRARLRIPFAPDWMPKLLELWALNLATGMPLITEAEPERREHRRRYVLEGILPDVATALETEGYVPGPVVVPRGDVIEWPGGYDVHRVSATAALELPVMLKAIEGTVLDREDFRKLLGADGSNTGYLFTEEEVTVLLQTPVGTLRNWRNQRRHLEFIKGPGTRGFILYTQRGLEAFIAKHLLVEL